MRIPRIYIPTPLSSNSVITLPKDAANHIIRVLRLKTGAALILFNGEGGEFNAVLERMISDGVTARICDYNHRECESPLDITLVQGISRAERMDYTIQKAVELGVTRIVPVFTERSFVDLRGERLHRRLEHWRSVVIGACEQCGRNRIPTIDTAVKLIDWLHQPAPNVMKLVLNHRATSTLRHLACQTQVTLLIGPEGGLDKAELTHSERAGFIGLNLGPRILRTETAAVAALAALQAFWGDF